jgi:predicted aminopeptidase
MSRWGVGATLLLLGLAAGCQSIGYYAHVGWGHLRLLADRQPVEALRTQLEASNDGAARQLARQLAYSQAVLDFAIAELHLPVGRNYRTYVELQRPHVVWNVFAAPEFSLAPHTWCYPVAGCAPYRGYFTSESAERTAAMLAARGMDVHVGGVAAYSTLGWFADPLLSSFINWSESGLAELLLHELAHGRVWVAGDVGFNESYANFVGIEGAAQFRATRVVAGRSDASVAVRAAWPRLVGLLTHTREQLARVYASAVEPGAMRLAKAGVLAAARDCYQRDRNGFGGGRYDLLMDALNNAVLASVGTYEDHVPAFARLFEVYGGDWQAFHAAVASLGALPDAARGMRLAELRDQQIAEYGDDHRTDQIECEALLRHGSDAEVAGAEHDHVGGGRNR